MRSRKVERGVLVGIVTTSGLLHAVVGPHAVGPNVRSNTPAPETSVHAVAGA